MIKFICIIFLCSLIPVSLAKISKRQQELEWAIFQPSSSAKPLDPKQTLAAIQELHQIHSSSEEGAIYKDVVEKLAELPEIASCDEDAFLKFNLLEDLEYNENIRSYIRDQRIVMSRQCDKKSGQEFSDIIHKMDDYVRESIYSLGTHVAKPYNSNEITLRPLFFRNTLIKGIDEFLAEVSSKYRNRELLSREELDYLYKSSVLVPCRGLSSEFDRMARFYSRNYLDRGTLKECEDLTKTWTYFSEICSTVSGDSDRIADTLSKLVVKKNAKLDSYVYKILEEI